MIVKLPAKVYLVYRARSTAYNLSGFPAVIEQHNKNGSLLARASNQAPMILKPTNRQGCYTWHDAEYLVFILVGEDFA